MEKKIPSDPRVFKKQYMKVLGSDFLYQEFLALFDEAVAEGSSIPVELAWIRFKQLYRVTPDGWMPVP